MDEIPGLVLVTLAYVGSVMGFGVCHGMTCVKAEPVDVSPMDWELGIIVLGWRKLEIVGNIDAVSLTTAVKLSS